MKYQCGTYVMLGDEITVVCSPDQESLARIVAIGMNLAIDDIDPKFYSWAKGAAIIDKDTVVVEWVGVNPLANNDLNHAPVGNYMTLGSVCCETFIRRESNKVTRPL